MRRLIIAAALAFVAGAAAAEVDPQSIRWQLKRPKAAVEDIASVKLADGSAKIGGRLQARVKLLNRGPAIEGVLLRYSLAAKIAPADGSIEPMIAVPFMIDEKRVPRAAANQYFEVSVDPTQLVELYLRRISRDGFRAREFRLQIMVSPRRGDRSIKMVESALPVEP